MQSAEPQIAGVPAHIIASAVAQARHDDGFLAALQKDLPGALATRFGIKAPDGLRLLEYGDLLLLRLDDEDIARWCLTDELSDADLDLVSGGKPQDCSTTIVI